MEYNNLEVKKMKSEYCDEEHLTIVVDNVPLDVLLHNLYPANRFLGLIPTILGWIDDPKEKVLLKRRYDSTKQEVILPVLMCPDDCDLWCTVIVAKVVIENEYVVWDKIGVDTSIREEMLKDYECMGSRVEWLNEIPRMIFTKEHYYTQLNMIYS